MKNIAILGSTGSIGTQALEVVKAFPEQFSVRALSAGRNMALFQEQLLVFQPAYASVFSENEAVNLRHWVQAQGLNIEVGVGEEGLIGVATYPGIELLLVAIVGTASLVPTYRAILQGIPIGLACKEVLVSAGDILMPLAKAHGVPILPIDSEHAALKQCLAGIEDFSQVEKLILTASGGPFRGWTRDQLQTVTLQQALKHPKWSMGAKITIDSATLMNKGLEVIEAHHLFGMPFDRIEVTVHPQSIIHSLVEFKDGTLLSQMGLPDMRFPIQYVMTYPEKWSNQWPKTKLSQLTALEFFEPDLVTFPLLKLAFEMGKKGGTYPAVMNAANEAAVHLFLNQKIGFLDIEKIIINALESFSHQATPALQDIVALDTQVKERILYDPSV